MKVLHTADWHIGSFKGPEENGVNLRSEDTMKCLMEMVRVAHEEKPDLILVSGDIFHQAEIWQGRSHREVLQARGIIMELSKAAKLVVVMRGTPNHDSQEAFDELKAHFELVENVKIVTEPTVVQAGQIDIIAVPGFDKGQFRAKYPGLSKEQENQIFSDELGNAVVGLKAMCGPDKTTILMSHYTVPGCNTESGQTQFLTQFEPVITQEMLLAADYDLVALGHIHRPQQINGLKNVFYSGAINAMNFNDEGQERGFWIHEFSEDVVSRRFSYVASYFRKTPYREFKTITWSVSDVEQAINNPDMLPMTFAQNDVADKIVRIIYSCTPDQKKAFNDFQIEKALYDAGAFWKSDISMDKLENANRTELSKYDVPETNLLQYLSEKQIEPAEIDQIVERARPIIARALANEAVSEFFGTFVPKEIAVKNYRNYVEQSFSFEYISFCTINGQNGVGKSSLFMDAILDGLFEEPREGTNTGWIRNDEKARSGSIAFTFGLGEKVFRVVRTRTKSGKPTLNLSEFVENEWIDRSKEKINDTQAEIVRVLGMDSLTFKACVLIMQDQYGLFLEAGMEERVGVLSNLLGLGIYGIMEGLARDQLGILKRDIVGKKKTIEVHTNTILGYGTPEDEKEIIDREITVSQEQIQKLTSEKEDKSLVLRMQNKAEERRNKVQTSVNTLEAKKVATGQIIASLGVTITGCESALTDEAVTNERVDRYYRLVEQDKELSQTAAVYQSKTEELSRLQSQIRSEESTITGLNATIEAKQSEIESMRQSADDEIIRDNAAEFEKQKKLLDEAHEKERQYCILVQNKQSADYAIQMCDSKCRGSLESLKREEEILKKKTEILDNVECVDIENAKCGFLLDALNAKKQLEEFDIRYQEIRDKEKTERIPLQDKFVEVCKQIETLAFDESIISAISEKVAELKPYVAKLDELNQRESRIALISASITNYQSNIADAEKRLSEVKLKASEIESALPTYRSAAEKHNEVATEISLLKPYVDKAGTYPVIKERKKNAENQQADEVIRLSEIEKELSEAKEELSNTHGATLNVEQLKAEIVGTDNQLVAIQKSVANKQQEIGSLIQKIEEKDRLQTEIATIQKQVRDLSREFSDYDILKSAFSQDGIPHQIIRSLVPKLTEVSSSILGQMTGGKMGIEFQTEKVIKSNTQKEVVTLDIFIEEYGKTVLPYLSKSGGEKVKASLSVILALAEIKSSSAGIQLGMLFIDEPPFLDSEGIQAYCDALETIQSRYPDLKIMAITHDPTMKARFPQSLDVVKTDEGSKVIYE